jgi:hypothetical protein
MAIWRTQRPFGIFFGRLLHFVVIWHIFPVLVCCAKKNLATLALSIPGIVKSLKNVPDTAPQQPG